ncbi:MAG: prepilin-type N-terminal cleavage/methylation domain-containing protein, partial [Pseudomonadales bacterium]|nr:prepilin-type N-terminal cleavage/methylation domain-containing protein [Pseudomonadales bacterium]
MVNISLTPSALNEHTASKPLLGFTLIELLITSTIITLLVSMAVPSFAKLWQKQQADVYIETLQRAMATARYSAITS